MFIFKVTIVWTRKLCTELPNYIIRKSTPLIYCWLIQVWRATESFKTTHPYCGKLNFDPQEVQIPIPRNCQYWLINSGSLRKWLRILNVTLPYNIWISPKCRVSVLKREAEGHLIVDERREMWWAMTEVKTELVHLENGESEMTKKAKNSTF
jgi:hypothetical protein